MLYTILAGGVDTGWTFYVPLSTEFLKNECHNGRGGGIHLRFFRPSLPDSISS